MRDSSNSADNPGLPENESVESLRQILEDEQSRSITYEEAEEIGEALIRLFEAVIESVKADDEEVASVQQHSNQII